MTRTVLVMLALSSLLGGASQGSRVLYVGGTVSAMVQGSAARVDFNAEDGLSLRAKNGVLEIPYRDINTLEYGVRVSHRYVEAVLISPLFLMAGKKAHYVTIGYIDANGKQQAMVLQVGKAEIRPLLVSLEARTGRRIEYQDEEARKAGRG